MRIKKAILIGVMLLSMGQSCLAGQRYFMCGADEDGCFPDESPEGCLCMPQDDNITANKPYCLHLLEGACVPITEKTPCHEEFTAPTQSECLALLYQSEPTPPCPLKTRDFCEEHHIVMCRNDEGYTSCH